MSSDRRASTYLERGRPNEDRLQGERAEQMFQDFLRKKGRHPEPNPGGFHPDWDIRDEDFTYEVKLDRKVQETGNVYVERKSLFNSKADYLVYLFHVAHADPRVYFIFIAPAAKVRNRVRGNPASWEGISRNPDGS